jgi:mannose/cellobiose epimerase-like protein (N-acyl-D-glucosamine 2-epimerase family)
MVTEGNYRQQSRLEDEIERILGFYYPDCLDDTHGGYVAQFDEATGEVYDRESKHLVATARFATNFALADRLGGPEWCRPAAQRGIDFLLDTHRDADRGGFHWLLDGTDPADSRRICYGHAFVLLALARGSEAGIDRATEELEGVYDLIDERFWEPDHGLCKSAYDPDWTSAEEYRGQNANMHTCEAMIAAYEATGDEMFLARAMTIAESLTVALTDDTDGLVWEHYTAEWEHDFEYNRDDPTHTFRPWGYQPGHQIEWAKLLAVLSRYHDASWLVPRAVELFDAAIDHGWDDDRGGFYYSFDLDRDPLVTEKYSWEVAEAIGAAAALADRTSEERYLDWYDRFWAYADEHLIASDARNWYTKVTEENEPVPTTDGVAVEPGYHPIGACFEGIRSLE